jgi:hypothetical protein
MLNAFERRVLRKIYGPTLVNEQMPNRYNHEIYKLYQKGGDTHIKNKIWDMRSQFMYSVTKKKANNINIILS